MIRGRLGGWRGRLVRFRRFAWSGRRQRRVDRRGRLGGLRLAFGRNGLRLRRRAGRRFPAVVGADGRGNLDVRSSRRRPISPPGRAEARSGIHRLSGGPATPGGGSPNPSSRAASAGSPDSARCGEALKDLPVPGVDDEALITGGAGADVGEIDPWPPHERPCQHISLRLETPFDLAGGAAPPRRRQPLGRCGGNEGEGDERAERRTRQATAQRSIQFRSSCFVAPGFP